MIIYLPFTLAVNRRRWVVCCVYRLGLKRGREQLLDVGQQQQHGMSRRRSVFLFFSLYRCRCALVVIDLQNKADEAVKKMSSKGAIRDGRLKADERGGEGWFGPDCCCLLVKLSRAEVALDGGVKGEST